MTVKELMGWLEKLPPDLRVVMPGEVRDFCEVESAFEDLMAFTEREVQLADERDSDAVRVVRLFGSDEE